MWTLILILYLNGSAISILEIPNQDTRSACMNKGAREKAILEAEDKAVTVRYRCIKLP